MELSLGKQLSFGTEGNAEQVLSVTQGSSASKPICSSPGQGEPMAMTSPSQPISFQPPLPTSAPSPPPGRQLVLKSEEGHSH